MPPTPAQLFNAAQRVIRELVAEKATTGMKFVKSASAEPIVGRMEGFVSTAAANKRMFERFGPWREAVQLADDSVLTQDGGDLMEQLMKKYGTIDPVAVTENVKNVGFVLPDNTFISKDEAQMIANWFGDDAKYARVKIHGRGLTALDRALPEEQQLAGGWVPEQPGTLGSAREEIRAKKLRNR